VRRAKSAGKLFRLLYHLLIVIWYLLFVVGWFVVCFGFKVFEVFWMLLAFSNWLLAIGLGL